MAHVNKVGLAIGGAILLSGVLLRVAEWADASGVPMRTHDVLRRLGGALPIPDNPLLINVTLAFLNMPVWLILTILGLVVSMIVWLVRRRPARHAAP